MPELVLTLADAEATRDFAARLARLLQPGDLVLLIGGLGAGKTTFTQGLARGLGVRGPISSPTFIIAREHPSLGTGPDLVHVDAYRLGDLAGSDALAALDALDLDLDDSVVVVEWGQGLVERLTQSRLEIELDRGCAGRAPLPIGADWEWAAAAEPRQVRVRGIGPRWAGVNLD